MLTRRLRSILRIQKIALSIASACFGAVIAYFGERPEFGDLIWVIAGVGVVALAVYLLALLRQREDIPVDFPTPQTITNADEARDSARAGFVGFVPPFRALRDSPAAHLSPAEIEDALRRRDYALLHVERSNLQPTVYAIASHTPKLRHCWLLATVDSSAPLAPGAEAQSRGSLLTAEFLVSYLREKHGVQCRFHVGRGCTVALDDEPLVAKKTYQLVRRVFTEAEQMGLPAGEVVADITTGVRSMSLGMVLASLHREHDIEFVGTSYDAAGRQGSDLQLIIFSFEPRIAGG